jgi:hypothetical protein
MVAKATSGEVSGAKRTFSTRVFLNKSTNDK